MALQGFDEAFYLNAKLAALSASYPEWTGKSSDDLKQFLNSVGLTPEQHYELYGWGEKLNPNACFNGDEYTAYKAQDLFNSMSFGFTSIDQARQAFLNAWPQNPYLHYLQFGGAEGPDMSGLNPGNNFDSSSYLEAKLALLQATPETQADWTGKTITDLAEAFVANRITPLTHYLAWGKDEGLTPTPVPAGEQPEGSSGTPGEVFVLTEEIDNLTGTANDDTFRGNTTTINGGDSIDGGAGVDTFEVFYITGTPLSHTNPPYKPADLVSLSNVEIITSRGDLDVAGVAGVQEAEISGDAGKHLTVSAGMIASVKEGRGVTTVTFDGDQPTDTATLKFNSVGSLSANAPREITVTAQAETVNLANTGESFGHITDTAVTDLSLSGDGSLESHMKVAALETLHISGSLDTELWFDPSQLSTIDAGTASGDLAIAAVTSPSSLEATTGSGDDHLGVQYAQLDGMKIDLGSGKDEIALGVTNTDVVTPAFYTAVNAVNNAEILGIWNTMTAGQEIDFASLDHIDSLALHNANIGQVSSATDSTTITFTGVNAAPTTISSLAGQNTIGLQLMAEDGAIADVTSGATVTGTTTVNLDSSQENADGNLVNTLALTVNDNQTVNVTGNAGLVLDLKDGQNTLTSGIILNAAATTKGITMTAAIDNQVTSDRITGGSGDDTLFSGVIDGGTTGDILTGGDGNDTFDVSDSFIVTPTDPEMATITDVASGEKIQLIGSANTIDASMTNVVSASSLNEFLSQVMAANGTAHNVAWGQYEQNTYLVVANDANSAFTAGEQVVKLEGTVDLSGAAVDDTSGMLTLA